MEVLVAVLVIALIAAIAFIVMQRRPGGARRVGRPHTSPIGRRHRGVRRRDPMAAAVEEHAQAIDPADAIVAEQRLQAQARHVAAGLNAESHRVEHQRVADQVGDDAYLDPAPDPRYAGPAPESPQGDPATDPRYDDRRYDGRLADDYVDPRDADRRR